MRKFLIVLLALLMVPITAKADVPFLTASGTLGALNASVIVTGMVGQSSCTTTFGTGLVGTAEFRVSNDNATWTQVTSYPDPGSTTGGVKTVVNPGASNYQSPIGSYKYFEVDVSLYTSGSATAAVNCSGGVAFRGLANGGGGGDTITSPNSTLTVGGTSSATTLDVSLSGIANNPCIGTNAGGTAFAAPSSACALVGSANAFTAANTHSGLETFSNIANVGLGSTSCNTIATTTVGVCGPSNQGATNFVGLALGPQTQLWTCSSSCTTGDSTKIVGYRGLATGPDNGSGANQIYWTFGGSLVISASGGVITNNKNLSSGTGTLTGGKLLQNVTNDFAGTCTNSTAGTCTATLVSAFTTPLCFAADQSTTNQVQATCAASSTTVTVTNTLTGFSGSCATAATTTCTITAPYGFTSPICVAQDSTFASATVASCAISGTTITVTSSSGTRTYNVHLLGIPTASSHVFNYFIIGNPT